MTKDESQRISMLLCPSEWRERGPLRIRTGDRRHSWINLARRCLSSPARPRPRPARFNIGREL